MQTKKKTKKTSTALKIPNDFAHCLALAQALYGREEVRELIEDKFREVRRNRLAEGITLKKLSQKERGEAVEAIRKKRIEAGRLIAEARWRLEKADPPELPSDAEAVEKFVAKTFASEMMVNAYCRVVGRARRSGYIRPERRTKEQNEAMAASRSEKASRAGRSKRTITDRFLSSVSNNSKAGLAVINATHATSKMKTFGGETHCIHDWSIKLGLTYTAMRNRFSRYPVEIALNPDFDSLAPAYRKEHPAKFPSPGRRSGSAKKSGK